MRVITKAILDIGSLEWELVESVPYHGPWELLDRAAQNAAKKAAGTAAGTAATEGGNASAIGAQLTPFYKQEINTVHGFDPEQTNELLNYAEAGAGGANASLAGQAASEAARTRNTSGFTSALDQASRDRQKALSNASLGVGAQDIEQAKRENQEGAAGLSGLYDTDTNAMLKAMGIQNEDINTEIQAGKSGWFQNLMNGIQTVGSLGK